MFKVESTKEIWRVNCYVQILPKRAHTMCFQAVLT